MEKEKKGLFGRLLDFWKEKVGMGETDSIGFWNGAENVENHLAERGAVALLNQKKTRKAFWEEEAVILEGKEMGSNALESQKKVFLAETEERKEEAPKFLEEPEKDEEKKKASLFSAEVFREEKQEETGETGFGRIFFREMPVEEREKRSIVPITVEPVQEKEPDPEEEQEMPKREVSKREESQAEPMVDIEKLMRQMTKKLWEERESCGRRLR